MNDFFSLKDQVIILTGGAGLYGRGLVHHLARTGCKLAIASRNLESLQKVAAEEQAEGYQVEAFQLDQGDPESIDSFAEKVVAHYGRIDGLVNNAVIRAVIGMDASWESWETSMRVNAIGLHRLTHKIGEILCQQESGSIVNIGSMQGMIGPDFSLYKGTDMKTAPDYFFHKGGMINMTKFFASAYGPHGVRVNCLSPGGFFNNQPEPFLSRYKDRTFLGRMAGPDDLAGSVIFLLSPASQYITGANLPVDGGYTAK